MKNSSLLICFLFITSCAAPILTPGFQGQREIAEENDCVKIVEEFFKEKQSAQKKVIARAIKKNYVVKDNVLYKTIDGQEYRMGEIETIRPRYLYEWQDQEMHEYWLENGIDKEEMDFILTQKAQSYGRGYYISLDPVDSIEYGSHLTIFEVSEPMVVLKGFNHTFENDEKELNSLRSVGFAGIRGTDTWFNIFNEKYLGVARKLDKELLKELQKPELGIVQSSIDRLLTVPSILLNLKPRSFAPIMEKYYRGEALDALDKFYFEGEIFVKNKLKVKGLTEVWGVVPSAYQSMIKDKVLLPIDKNQLKKNLEDIAEIFKDNSKDDISTTFRAYNRIYGDNLPKTMADFNVKLKTVRSVTRDFNAGKKIDMSPENLAVILDILESNPQKLSLLVKYDVAMINNVFNKMNIDLISRTISNYIFDSKEYREIMASVKSVFEKNPETGYFFDKFDLADLAIKGQDGGFLIPYKTMKSDVKKYVTEVKKINFNEIKTKENFIDNLEAIASHRYELRGEEAKFKYFSKEEKTVLTMRHFEAQNMEKNLFVSVKKLDSDSSFYHNIEVNYFGLKNIEKVKELFSQKEYAKIMNQTDDQAKLSTALGYLVNKFLDPSQLDNIVRLVGDTKAQNNFAAMVRGFASLNAFNEGSAEAVYLYRRWLLENWSKFKAIQNPTTATYSYETNPLTPHYAILPDQNTIALPWYLYRLWVLAGKTPEEIQKRAVDVVRQREYLSHHSDFLFEIIRETSN